MTPETASAHARLFGNFARLWDHYWVDHRGTRPAFVRYAVGSNAEAIIVAVPLRLEDLAPFVDWMNERPELRVRPETGDLPATRWWGEWSALRVLPPTANWISLGQQP